MDKYYVVNVKFRGGEYINKYYMKKKKDADALAHNIRYTFKDAEIYI